MENLDQNQLWLIILLVGASAFMLGRATAGSGAGGGGGESREERRMREAHDAEQVFSSLSPSKQAEVDRLLIDGKLIQAIRLIREDTGLGLKESKLAADHRKRMVKGAPS